MNNKIGVLTRPKLLKGCGSTELALIIMITYRYRDFAKCYNQGSSNSAKTVAIVMFETLS